MGFFDFLKKEKTSDKPVEEEEKIEEEKNVVEEFLDKANDAFDTPELNAYVEDSEKVFEEIQAKNEPVQEESQQINTTATRDIDEVLTDIVKLETKIFAASTPKSEIDSLNVVLTDNLEQLYTYMRENNISELMERYRQTDYTKYSIIDLEQHLMNESNDFIKKACRTEQYSDRVVSGMFKNGIDLYNINERIFSGVTSPDKGEWLITRLVQQNAIENAHYNNPSKKAEKLELAQIAWRSTETGLPSIDVEKAIKEVVSKDFDKGYWVQTELDILTLPLEQKQELRAFRDQNKKEGNYFEPGTLITQYNESTGKNFEAGAKK